LIAKNKRRKRKRFKIIKRMLLRRKQRLKIPRKKQKLMKKKTLGETEEAIEVEVKA
jgi:hypothetical protein